MRNVLVEVWRASHPSYRAAGPGSHVDIQPSHADPRDIEQVLTRR